GFQPYDLKEGPKHWDEIKEQVSQANLAALRKFATNLTDDKILARVVESPLDLERMNPHNWRGSCHGGAQNVAQSANMRPVPGWASHRMPIAGLYQTGSTTHPGGSISAGPGRHTLMLTSNGHTVAAVLNKSVPFDPVKDFSGVTQVASVPLVLIAPPDLPVKTLKELIALAKEKPGTLNFASSGLASTAYVS